MRTLIVVFVIFTSSLTFAQKWEDCCWTKMKSGSEIKIVNKGKGKKVKIGDTIYVGWILYDYKTGNVVYDAISKFPEGMKWVIFRENMVGSYIDSFLKLKRGGSAFIKIPPELAFGDTGYLGQTTLCYFITIIK